MDSLIELDEYLELEFIKRSGCGIGVTRLIKSMEKEGLLDKNVSQVIGRKSKKHVKTY